VSEFEAKTRVRHPDFGEGVVVAVLGDIVRANFLGEEFDVDRSELQPIVDPIAAVQALPNGERKAFQGRAAFHRTFEAINLGVVPPDPDQLIDLTIDSHRLVKHIDNDLKRAPKHGLCKGVFGYYGAGKSHYLRVAKSVALRKGWVVAYVEFDPKAADPAKPHLVYRNITAALEFPERDDGSRAHGFLGLVREVREQWQKAGIRNLPYFSKNAWFKNGFAILLAHTHDETDEAYVAACAWLGGETQRVSLINRLARDSGLRIGVPRMPATLESAEIYCFHLVVINEIVKALGYSGLLLVLDEAEHVRGYNVRRQERATSFFDYLARSAHLPLATTQGPYKNAHGWELPDYWFEGPHFGLYVGLTEGDIFSEPSEHIRDACVFLHDKEDKVRVRTPKPEDYEHWCRQLFDAFHHHYPDASEGLASPASRRQMARILKKEFETVHGDEVPLRLWTKLAGLACSYLVVRSEATKGQLAKVLETAARQTVGY